jgi:hypothetical protein
MNGDADFGETIVLADSSGTFEVRTSRERSDNERDLRDFGCLIRGGP